MYVALVLLLLLLFLLLLLLFSVFMNTRKRKTICLTESNQNVEQGGVRIDLASTHNTYILYIFFISSSYTYFFAKPIFTK